jgi:hypothetical protein
MFLLVPLSFTRSRLALEELQDEGSTEDTNDTDRMKVDDNNDDDGRRSDVEEVNPTVYGRGERLSEEEWEDYEEGEWRGR